MRNFEADKLVRVGDVMDFIARCADWEVYDENLEDFVEHPAIAKLEAELLRKAVDDD